MNKTIWICVYRDTIEQHDESNNLTEIKVEKEFAERYFNECIKTLEDNIYSDFEEFLDEYTADDTENFYDFAVKNNAIIDKENW